MNRPSKRFQKCQDAVEPEKAYSLREAVSLLKDLPPTKFDQSVEIACHLNIDPKQSEQLVRGATILPHGIGKEVKIAVFAKGEDAVKAKNTGADFVGSSELIQKIKGGWLEFDRACSTPEMMREVAQLGKILGPRGMMPSPKSGTVGPDIARLVRELKSGKVQFKTDKTANIHVVVGKISFSLEDICDNAAAMLKAIFTARPAAVKGRFIKSSTIALTMGPGIKLDIWKISA